MIIPVGLEGMVPLDPNDGTRAVDLAVICEGKQVPWIAVKMTGVRG